MYLIYILVGNDEVNYILGRTVLTGAWGNRGPSASGQQMDMAVGEDHQVLSTCTQGKAGNSTEH